jgi:hypothetical protein
VTSKLGLFAGGQTAEAFSGVDVGQIRAHAPALTRGPQGAGHQCVTRMHIWSSAGDRGRPRTGSGGVCPACLRRKPVLQTTQADSGPSVVRRRGALSVPRTRFTGVCRGTIVPMSSEVAVSWVATVATLGSAVAAVMAWKAAKSSAKATGELTDLEAARRHDELTPEFTAKVEAFNPGDPMHYRLTLGLDGPVALIRLEAVTIKVRDDRPGRDQESLVGSEATPEKVRAQVWGPLRFGPRLGPAWAQADETGRSVTVTRTLDVGEGVSFQMERTPPPPWYRHLSESDEVWRRDAGTLLRLSVVAVPEESSQHWVLPIEVNLASEGVAGFASSTDN